MGLCPRRRKQDRRPANVHEPHGHALDDGRHAGKAETNQCGPRNDLHVVRRDAEKQYRPVASAAIPIGPHWMITWPFDAAENGLPTTVRDKGAWVMFAGTPYEYLHVCGSPWEGNEYHDGDQAVWTMSYARH